MKISAKLAALAGRRARGKRMKRARRFAADVAKGFVKDAMDTARGLKDVAVGVWKLTAGALIDPRDAAQRWRLVGHVAKAVLKNPMLLPKAVLHPYVEAWKAGHPGEIAGRLLFEVTTMLAVGETMSKL